MDVKIVLIDEGSEGRKVTVTVADDKGVQVTSQELQTPGADVQPTGPQGRPGVADRAEDRKDVAAPPLPTETQFKLPAGGSVKVVEADSPQVYDGDQRASYNPESQAAKDKKAEEAALRTGPAHPKSGQPLGQMMAGPGPEPQYQGANPAIHPAKTPGDMTADEAQKAHAAGQAEAQRTGTAQPGTQPTPQQAKVDESKGKVDMSKTVSPSTKK